MSELEAEPARGESDTDPLSFDYWYHTIELPDGRTTPGDYDHRSYLRHYGFPTDLTGQSVLDVGPADGFFAFEFERRGAARVVTLDLDPSKHERRFPGSKTGHQERFRLLRKMLSSTVEARWGDIYDLSPKDLGLFDLVFCGDLLMHLSDPVRALENLRSVTRGTAVIVTLCQGERFLRLYETLSRTVLRVLGSQQDPTCAYFLGTEIYWLPTRASLLSMTAKAGFRSAKIYSRFLLPRAGRRFARTHLVMHAKSMGSGI